MRTHEKDTASKNVYVILGMARSGTSTIARGLKALGVDLGEKLTPASERWNPKGFWEDSDIVYKINRGVLYALDHPWMSMNLIDKFQKNSGALHDLKSSAIALLKQRIANTQHWGFKDPRTAKLIPFWRDVFNTMNVNDSYIIALRNPLSSAHSYQSLSGCDLEEALLLWLMHLVPAIDETHGKERVVVSYDLLLQDPHLQLNRIKKGLNLPDLGSPADIDTYVNEFLDKKLHHYEYSFDDLQSHPATLVAPLCLKVYEVLLKLAKDELRFDDPTFMATWQNIKEELARFYPIYNYIDALLKKNKQLVRKIRTTHKSILWKMLYPLRIIDDALRSRRQKARENRRLLKSV
jgi:hypothetical protein